MGAEKVIWLICAAALVDLWLGSLVNSDGKCHYEDCDGCAFSWDCTERKEEKTNE